MRGRAILGFVSRKPLTVALWACVVASALSLLLPYGPLYDAWVWLVWGRELIDWNLDTSSGASWKPLTVLVTAPLTAADEAAPDLWLVVARAGWFAAPVLAYVLAYRLEGSRSRSSIVAGLVAALGLILLHDEVTAWARHWTGGLSEPLLTSLILGACLAWFDSRLKLAFALIVLACLLRPEAWPFAALVAIWARRRGRLEPVYVLSGATIVAALWFLPDLIASDSALTGAERARGGADPGRALGALERGVELPPYGLWAAAVIGLGLAGRKDRKTLILFIGALAWIGLVVAMAVGGFAGLPRFMSPAAAIVCVAGGVGLARLLQAPRTPALRAAMVVIAAALVIDGAVRAAKLPGVLDRAAGDEALVGPLLDLAAEDPAAFGCTPLATEDFRAKPALSWELELPLDAVESVSSPKSDGTLVIGPETRKELGTDVRGAPVASAGEWRLVRLPSCDVPSDSESSGSP